MRPARVTVLAALLAGSLTACGSAGPAPSARPTSAAPASDTPTERAPTVASTTSAAPPQATRTPSVSTRAGTSRRPASPVRRTPAGTTGRRLPLDLPTGSATQVLTVVAPGTGSTTATVQAWSRSAGGWTRVGAAVPAFVGSDGLSRHASESRSATPIGSFTLTQAFGALADPGSGLPYRRTDATDWWVSQAGPLYNTLQHCRTGCAFTQGSPNEHLYAETPAYDYAAVIDYNTADAPGGVRAGAGSAFFLHVSQGEPTAGCVSIPRDGLVRILRWLDPARHPRILIGT